jgi:hypothetical protein
LAKKGDDATRLRWAFAECVSRPPQEKEFVVILAALKRERVNYAKNEPAARALLSVGESPRDEKLPAAEHAAWTQIASTLFNLSETITRN